MLADVTPSSSAAIIAKTVQRRTLNRSTSSCVRAARAAPAKSDRRACGSHADLSIALRIEASSETSALNAWQRPSASARPPAGPSTTGTLSSAIWCRRKYAVSVTSCSEPSATHTGTPCQLRRAIDLEAPGDEKSLTVVERDRAEHDVQPFTAQRPGQAARDDVDIAGALKEIDRGNRLGIESARRTRRWRPLRRGRCRCRSRYSCPGDPPGRTRRSREDTADEEAALADARDARSRSSEAARCRQHGGDEERRDGAPHNGEGGGHQMQQRTRMGHPSCGDRRADWRRWGRLRPSERCHVRRGPETGQLPQTRAERETISTRYAQTSPA